MGAHRYWQFCSHCGWQTAEPNTPTSTDEPDRCEDCGARTSVTTFESAGKTPWEDFGYSLTNGKITVQELVAMTDQERAAFKRRNG